MTILRNYARLILIILILTCFLVGCGNDETRSDVEKPSISGKASKLREFSIMSPRDSTEVDRNNITVLGTGAQPGASIQVEVFTDNWYVQNGSYQIGSNGAWTYSPCYLKGRGNYRLHHNIRAKLIVDGKVVAESAVYDVVAPEPLH